MTITAQQGCLCFAVENAAGYAGKKKAFVRPGWPIVLTWFLPAIRPQHPWKVDEHYRVLRTGDYISEFWMGMDMPKPAPAKAWPVSPAPSTPDPAIMATPDRALRIFQYQVYQRKPRRHQTQNPADD